MRLLRGFTVGIELGLAGGLIPDSSGAVLLPPNLETGSGRRLTELPRQVSAFLSSVDSFIVLSACLLTGCTTSPGEEINESFGSTDFLLREETRAGGLLSCRCLSSIP